MNRMFFVFMLMLSACSRPETVTLTHDQLMDKIKGGWAGQTIGCTFGGPTEFRYQGRIIPDSVEIVWPDGYIKWFFDNQPGLYDDIYMDLTFVDVFEKYGLDAPVDSFALAFAKAEYPLWHANQAARYNILNGAMPPQSGFWLNNPHADCIDFQIEADFAGLMAPAMPNAASQICDKIGHIMNSGDGWYGGVYVAAMYSLAFVYDDVEKVVVEALRAIPPQSTFYQCIHDVINWCAQYPDWKRTWEEVEKKWSRENGCPDGVFHAFNIDAKINAAYVVMGLLYGKGDFAKTMDISTRCGQDSDCNPATAAGILGTLFGYASIPEKWMSNLREVENLNFAFTQTSLEDVYKMSYGHALKMIERNQGSTDDKCVKIPVQHPNPVRLEQNFEQCYLGDNLQGKALSKTEETAFEFEGTGIVLCGDFSRNDNNRFASYEAVVEVYIDGKQVETMKLPYNFTNRKTEIYWKYRLPEGKHELKLKWLNAADSPDLNIWRVITYKNN